MNNQKPSRGEIWFVDLNPVVGHEQAKIRPCLIISHDTFNHGPANLHIILPLTSKNMKAKVLSQTYILLRSLITSLKVIL